MGTVLLSPPICTVLHYGYGVWRAPASGWAAGTNLRDHVDTTHDPLRTGGWGSWVTFLLKQPSPLGIFLAAWVSPVEVLALAEDRG